MPTADAAGKAAFGRLFACNKEGKSDGAWDACDRSGKLHEEMYVRGKPVPDGVYHLVCSVLVQHVDSDYLLMQRDLKTCSGYDKASVGGLVLKGETALEGVKCELWEETGIKVDRLRRYHAARDRNCLYYVFLCKTALQRIRLSCNRTRPLAIFGSA